MGRVPGANEPAACSCPQFQPNRSKRQKQWKETSVWSLSLPGDPGYPRRVFLVHGDPDATAPFAERLRRELGLDVHIPSYREVVALG